MLGTAHSCFSNPRTILLSAEEARQLRLCARVTRAGIYGIAIKLGGISHH